MIRDLIHKFTIYHYFFKRQICEILTSFCRHIYSKVDLPMVQLCLILVLNEHVFSRINIPFNTEYLFLRKQTWILGFVVIVDNNLANQGLLSKGEYQILPQVKMDV